LGKYYRRKETGMAKTIMIQGTASNVGKSLIVAGLCRIFKQDGWRVAPFKSQNMALNSYITRAGLEMGRAQVVQAEAAGIEPDTDMNPILLKPSSDTKSQVIVQGEIFGEENAEGYYSHKRALEPKIRESFERLSGAYDIIVLEGAGSPAEINLRENDIVNMYMARLARAPVILAGDIDRGGVFASLVGTMQLFTDEEKRLVRGVLINKFRGNEAILEPGLRQLEDLIHRPVLGVIPYMRLDIDDEDSLSERFHPQRSGPGGSGDDTVLADIAVIRFSRISNFTDFNALSRLPGVRLRYVEEREALGSPDMVILPGTKNTMADLLWIRRNGLEARIKELARRGTPVFGICGGYQMLGRTLADPDHVEEGGEMEGLGLLPVSTIFKKQKLRTRVRGRFGALGGLLKGLSGMDLEGYELHMGSSAAAAGEAGSNTAVPLAAIRDINAAAAAEAGSNSAGEAGFNSGSAALDGACLGNVYGGYVHGIFDGDGIAAALVKALCAAKGLDGAAALEGEMSFKAYKEKQYDILAATLRDHIDMNRIYRILEEGI
jgi:adenosylcobyric acid synthase